jgi:hypothetical protein
MESEQAMNENYLQRRYKSYALKCACVMLCSYGWSMFKRLSATASFTLK